MALAKRTRIYLAAGVVFFTPLVLLRFSARLEPYPAVLLPSGAYTAHLGQNEISLRRTTLLARMDPDSPWVPVKASRLIAPIPVQYIEEIVDSELGLGTRPAKPVHLKFLGHVGDIPPKVDAADVEQTRRWWRAALERNGYDPSGIRFVRTTETFEHPSLKLRATAPIHERTFDLH